MNGGGILYTDWFAHEDEEDVKGCEQLNLKAQFHFYHCFLFFSLRSTAWHLDVTICHCIKG